MKKLILACGVVAQFWAPITAAETHAGPSNDGSMQVEVEIAPPGGSARASKLKSNEPYEATVSIASASCPSRVELSAVMPAHYHGLAVAPVVSRPAKDACRFQVTGLEFQMNGAWQVHVDMFSGRRATRFSFPVDLLP